MERFVSVGFVLVGFGRLGAARLGTVWLGVAWQARHGLEVWARYGRARQARNRGAW
jgi:hypothetical protein